MAELQNSQNSQNASKQSRNKNHKQKKNMAKQNRKHKKCIEESSDEKMQVPGSNLAETVVETAAETLPETEVKSAETSAESSMDKVDDSNHQKSQKYEQSKTILRKLSVKANVKSLSTECYPLILNIIDEVLKLIINKLMEKQTKKTISLSDIVPVIQPISEMNQDITKDVINNDFVPIFTRAAFKRQVKRCMEDKYRISPPALKVLQHNVEDTIINILYVAQNISSNGNRKRVLKKDIELAWQMHNKYQQD